MTDVLVIATSHDIAVAEEHARTLDSYRVYFFDPTLVDAIAASTLRNAELLVWDECADYPALVKEGHKRAFEFERELQQRVGSLLPPGVSLEGWQHLNYFYFFTAFDWYTGLWRAVLPRFAGMTVHVFVCDNPANFYWPSFVPALLLLQYLRTAQMPFKALTYGARADESDVVMHLCGEGVDVEGYDVLTHLPTCFYDAPWFSQELKASGRRTLNVEPKYWSVPLETDHSLRMMRRGDQQLLCGGQPDIETIGRQLEGAIYQMLEPYLATRAYRLRQARHLASLYQSQLVNLYLLEQRFEKQYPRQFLLSDHDSGFHGPLIAFAEKRGIPVLMLPHAKTSDDTEFTYRGITMLTHPMQGGALYDGARRQVKQGTLCYPENWGAETAAPGPLKRVGLLLNGLSLNGIQCTPWETYLSGIVEMDRWCKENGIELSIRCRQGQSLIELLHGAIGIDKDSLRASIGGSLSMFAQSVDLCLMYDAPTNADIEFLRTQVPILNPVPAPLTKAEAATADAAIVPRDSVAGVLAMLDDFVSDPTAFHAFRVRQFANYVSLFTQAKPLRSYII
ncbi:hypothetical protein E4L96_13470 [Massilia arenosa]|uniref:Uncharacterized protein n=1 Tax=Zemynaea arenosa TaxID=2561931 RepID=A0A4Y9SCP6_9BURK|nr:hypothetical protein [Massilia arenosa]TFW18191.1 hypothetical protein E4L96_13470 [Massilia arenosa]